MPELPEVERARRLCHAHLVGKRIQTVTAAPDSIVYPEALPEHIQARLEGRTVVDTDRHGKLFWLVLDNDDALLMHLGMSGNVQIRGQEAPRYRNKPASYIEEWPPKYHKLLLVCDSAATTCAKFTQRRRPTAKVETATDTTHAEFAFTDPRRLARIRLCFTPHHHHPVSGLGFDPLHNLPDLKTFSAMVRQRKVSIKALLLDQKFSAGVGNWIADEILYQSKVHPAARSHELSDEAISTIRAQMHAICQLAVQVNADHTQFPIDWLFHHRWGKRHKQMEHRTHRGEQIVFVTVGGRTSAVVPEVQQQPTRVGVQASDPAE
ncbi:hypothetical protein H4R34_002217 [Dimargaris verticillata]|uniref:Formamidopyrimidine-DNA glycosylase catalytic domain-containing protein n=1 Tax=Dimargaris verticillata TaxID=2761393 RepID=A0A9W8EA66_9FUNG|nr:hypothetical protein H4R34_002217 [Dimargaris verticillata]